jgi:uncharacterized membrane protein
VKREFVGAAVLSILPALAVSLLYYLLLGYRRDYLGHFAAGYGATLTATALLLAIVVTALSPDQFRHIVPSIAVAATVLCIGAGAVTEATIFRFAKFDEIDFCNQSLGAVIAGVVAIAIAGEAKSTGPTFRWAVATGIVFVLVGAYFAFS